jgi:small-conductance mechanosensitive channel
MRIALIILASLFAFLLGFVGLYFVMPAIAPDTVMATQDRLDSLGILPLTPQDPHALAAVGHALPADSLHGDSTQTGTPGHAPSTPHLGTDPSQVEAQRKTILALQDSLQIANRRLNQLMQDQAALMNQMRELMEKLKSLEGQRTQVRSLSATLPKLEDKELAAILQQLDLLLLSRLYQEATERNRTRLLQNLSSERAAQFIRHLAQPTPQSAPVEGNTRTVASRPN